MRIAALATLNHQFSSLHVVRRRALKLRRAELRGRSGRRGGRAGAAGAAGRARAAVRDGAAGAVGVGLVPGARRAGEGLPAAAARRHALARADGALPYNRRAAGGPSRRAGGLRAWARWARCCRPRMPRAGPAGTPRLLAGLGRWERRLEALPPLPWLSRNHYLAEFVRARPVAPVRLARASGPISTPPPCPLPSRGGGNRFSNPE